VSGEIYHFILQLHAIVFQHFVIRPHAVLLLICISQMMVVKICSYLTNTIV